MLTINVANNTAKVPNGNSAKRYFVQRKAGQLLKKIPKQPDGLRRNSNFALANQKGEVIRQSGLTTDQAYKMEKLSEIPDGQFEYKIKEIQDEKRELTRAKLVREVNETFSPPAPKENEVKPKPQVIKESAYFLSEIKQNIVGVNFLRAKERKRLVINSRIFLLGRQFPFPR